MVYAPNRRTTYPVDFEELISYLTDGLGSGLFAAVDNAVIQPPTTGARKLVIAVRKSDSETVPVVIFTPTEGGDPVVDVVGNRITNLGAPSAGSDAARLQDVVSGTALPAPYAVKAATTADITLSGEQTIDDVVLSSGDVILVKDQADASENGIYEVAVGAWSRVEDFDSGGEVRSGSLVFVQSGTANAKTIWVLTTAGSIIVDTTDLTFERFGEAIGVTYVTEDELDTALDAAIADHEAAPDPHPQYLTEAEGDARYGLSSTETERVEDIAGAMVSGNAEDGLSVAYDDGAGKLNFTNTDKGSTAVATHEAAGDPHPQYQRESEKGVAGGYASLDGSGTVPDAQIPAAIARDTEVAAAISTHEAAPDPHPQYLTEAEGDARYGLSSTETERVQDIAGGMVSGNVEDGISATYDDTNGKLDLANTDKGSTAVATHEAASDPHPQYQRESEKGAANGYASLDAGTKVPVAQVSEVLALADLSDVAAKTGTGTTVVMQGSPTLTTPTIADFTNAGHTHQNAAGGGQLDHGAALTGLGDDDHPQYQLRTEKGANNGYASLDAAGKVPITQLPNSVMSYAGTWNASTNTPALADGAGNADDAIGTVYRVTVAGTQNLGSGAITFDVGDYAILNASKVWEKADATDAVTSVNGQQGVVVLDSDDVGEGATNLYHTPERVRDVIGAALVDSPTIDFTHDDGADTITADVKANSVDNTLTADMAQSTIKGRAAGAGTGDPTDLTPAQVVAIITAADGAGSGLDADLLDGANGAAYLDRANHTGTQAAATISDFNEAAQDAVGGVLTDTATVDLGYDDVTGAITADVKNNSIDNTKAADMAQATVKGRAAAAGTGDPTDLTAAQLVTLLTGADGAGSLLDADKLDGQEGAFYQDASNLNAGTLPAARFDDTAHGSRGGGTLHAAATSGANGFMPSTDKAKLDAATSSPTVSTVMMRDANGRAQVAAPSAAADIARKDTVDAVQANLDAHIGSGGSAHAVATTSTAGFMSSTDKAKLDAIEVEGDVGTIQGYAFNAALMLMGA